jgi:hypothetical protein
MTPRVWSIWRPRAGDEVEVDETMVGGRHEGHRGRSRERKALVGVIVEVRGQGSGRLRLQVLPDVPAGAP